MTWFQDLPANSTFDVFVIGVVLGFCLMALLVLGLNAWATARSKADTLWPDGEDEQDPTASDRERVAFDQARAEQRQRLSADEETL